MISFQQIQDKQAFLITKSHIIDWTKKGHSVLKDFAGKSCKAVAGKLQDCDDELFPFKVNGYFYNIHYILLDPRQINQITDV